MTETDTLSRAFQLAHSIYRFRKKDREIALKILSEAFSGVQVRLTAQHEADRHGPQKPSKVRWNTLQWLQLLIYYKSEAFERQQEQSISSLSQEDMIIRYIKHLIFVTSRRNSFYISLGLCRLLYNYGAAETIAIYDLVFQDPDGSTKKVDAYYRGIKNRILEEMALRFAGLIKIVHGSRGERKFQSEKPSEATGQLVVDYLRRFTPWDTECKLPARVDNWSTIQSLQSSQISQIHALTHPRCFSRIAELLGLAAPATRLAVPTFFLEKDMPEDIIPPSEGSRSDLTHDEAVAIRRHLSDLEQRRKKYVPVSVQVLANGIERERLNLTESGDLRFEIDDSITLIEIVGHDERGDLPLATHLRTFDDEKGQPTTYSIVIAGGQQIRLTIQELSENGDAGAVVRISYQESARMPFRSWWQRLTQSNLPTSASGRWWQVPIASGALLLVVAAALTLYSRFENSYRKPKELVSQVQPTPQTATVSPSQISDSPEIRPTPVARTSPESLNPPKTRSLPAGNTRESSIVADKSLVDIEKLYVEAVDDQPFSREVEKQIIEQLTSLHLFAISKNKNDSDAALIISARVNGRLKGVEIGKASFQIVNVAGEVLWRSSTLQGTAGEIQNHFAGELRTAIRQPQRRTKN